jgi:hypothetical protein
VQQDATIQDKKYSINNWTSPCLSAILTANDTCFKINHCTAQPRLLPSHACNVLPSRVKVVVFLCVVMLSRRPGRWDGWGQTYHVILCIYVGSVTSYYLIGQFSCFALRTMTPISLAAAHMLLLIILFTDARNSDSDSLTVFIGTPRFPKR